MPLPLPVDGLPDPAGHVAAQQPARVRSLHQVLHWRLGQSAPSPILETMSAVFLLQPLESLHSHVLVQHDTHCRFIPTSWLGFDAVLDVRCLPRKNKLSKLLLFSPHVTGGWRVTTVGHARRFV